MNQTNVESNMYRFVNKDLRENIFCNLSGILDELTDGDSNESINDFWNGLFDVPKAIDFSEFSFKMSKKGLNNNYCMVLFEFPFVQSMDENYYFAAALYKRDNLKENIRYIKLEDREGYEIPVLCEWEYKKGARVHKCLEIECVPNKKHFQSEILKLL